MSESDLYPALLLIAGGAIVLLPLVNRDTSAGRSMPCLICLVLMARTLVWRFSATLPPFDLTLESLWPYVFITFEALNSIGCMLLFVFLSRTIDRRPLARRHEAYVLRHPRRVAIFIPTYNEEKAILERTIIGAQSQDYGNFSVFVLDDGQRDWLRQLCAERGVGYITRAEKSHAKSGNLNNALAALARQDEPAEFIAVFDADFVAHPNFLKRTLALFHDPKVGCVQTPQHFFNPDPLQHGFKAAHRWPDEQRFFFDVILASKDAWGAAFCCGTSSVCRREALEAAGGFPTESITEDMLLTLKFKALGWKTVYLNERLSMGLAPEGVAEYITQRRRWCLGFFQIARSKWGPFGTARLPIMDRISLIDTFLYWGISFPFRVMCLAAPIVFGLTGLAAIDASAEGVLSHYGLSIPVNIIVLVWITRGRVLPVVSDASQLLVTRDAIAAAMTGLRRKKGHRFQVTAKGGDRTRVTVQWRLLIRFLLPLLALTLVAVVYATQSELSPVYGDQSRTIWLFWSYYNAIVIFVCILTCVEMPRSKSDNFLADEAAWLGAGGLTSEHRVLLLSTRGAVLGGKPALPLGSELALRLTNLERPLPARLTGKWKRTFEVEFLASSAANEALIRKLFSGDYQTGPQNFRVSDVCGAIAARVLD